MTEVLSRSPSTWNIGTKTKLSQNVAAGVSKPAMTGGGRRRHNKSSRRRKSRRRSSGSRKPKSVKGPRAVTSEERTPGNRILHSRTRGVKFDRTGVISSKLANGKKVVNHLRSNKNIRKTRSRTHGGDRKARPITNHDRRRTRGVWGSDGREDTGIRSGVERGTRVGDPLGAVRRRPRPPSSGLPGASSTEQGGGRSSGGGRWSSNEQPRMIRARDPW